MKDDDNQTKQPADTAIVSLNEGILKELKLVELEDKIELSPLGLLDIVISSGESYDPAELSDCGTFCGNKCFINC